MYAPPSRAAHPVNFSPGKLQSGTSGLVSQFSRYARFYQALLAAGVPLIGLQRRSKFPYRDSAVDSQLKTLPSWI